MKRSYNTPVREIISVLQDKSWHEIYEFHVTYNLSPVEIFEAVSVLLSSILIEKIGYKIRLKPELTNADLAILNRMKKTFRPKILDVYQPKHLTRVKYKVK